MPTYDYRCTSCKHEFTEQHRISDREIPLSNPCPECKTIGTVEKFISVAPGFGSMAVTRVPDGFKDVLRSIDKNTPGADLKNRSSFL